MDNVPRHKDRKRTVNILLYESTVDWMDQELGHGERSRYIRELISKDQRKRLKKAQKQLPLQS